MLPGGTAQGGHSLGALYAEATGGGGFDNAHDALADARALTTVWRWISTVEMGIAAPGAADEQARTRCFQAELQRLGYEAAAPPKARAARGGAAAAASPSKAKAAMEKAKAKGTLDMNALSKKGMPDGEFMVLCIGYAAQRRSADLPEMIRILFEFGLTLSEDFIVQLCSQQFMSLEKLPCLYDDNAALLKDICHCVDASKDTRSVPVRLMLRAYVYPDRASNVDIGNAVLKHNIGFGDDPVTIFASVLMNVAMKALPKLCTSMEKGRGRGRTPGTISIDILDFSHFSIFDF